MPVRRARTAECAIEDLNWYEEVNKDLPPETRRMMAVCVVGPRYGRKIAESVFGPLPTAPFRDNSWRWWNILYLADAGEKWDEFKELGQTDGTRKAVKWLRENTTCRQWQNIRRRAGVPFDVPDCLALRCGEYKCKGDLLWTKGGTWRIENPLTKILVLHQHLPQRELGERWQYRLGHEGVRLLEKELMHAIDPDAVLTHEAQRSAFLYIRRRVPEMLNAHYPLANIRCVVWFLQTPLPDEDGTRYFVPRGSKVIGFKGRPIGKLKALSF